MKQKLSVLYEMRGEVQDTFQKRKQKKKREGDDNTEKRRK